MKIEHLPYIHLLEALKSLPLYTTVNFDFATHKMRMVKYNDCIRMQIAAHDDEFNETDGVTGKGISICDSAEELIDELLRCKVLN